MEWIAIIIMNTGVISMTVPMSQEKCEMVIEKVQSDGKKESIKSADCYVMVADVNPFMILQPLGFQKK